MNLKNAEQKSGYDQEELYFEKLNRELINRMKAPRQGEEPRTESNVIQFPVRNAKADDKKAA